MPRFLTALLLALACTGAAAGEPRPAPDAAAIQQDFNRRYQAYLRPDSQMPLPFPRVEVPDWNKLLESRPLRKLYAEPGKPYNNKVYTFTLYRAEDDGTYYLDAKGGFWGMDELVYGPIEGKELR